MSSCSIRCRKGAVWKLVAMSIEPSQWHLKGHTFNVPTGTQTMVWDASSQHLALSQVEATV